MEDGYISKVGSAPELLPQLDPQITLTDCTGKLIVSGFIDAHVHFVQTRGRRITAALELIRGGAPVPWRPSPIPRPAEPPVRVSVDGEVFDVATQSDHPGHYHYAWISGPNPGYGFSSASSDGRPSSMVDHEKAIRKFLSHVDPVTGYIE